MVENTVISGITREIVATNVSFEEYLEHYAADFCEWTAGIVVKCPPIDGRHDELNRYMAMLMEAYLPLRPIGRIREAPFVMRLPAIARSREPDLQIILNTNPHALTQTYMDGPADICIEVVSPESVQRDHGAKFEEYEKGGVPEYWILDPIHRETRFYRLDEDGVYVAYSPDEHGYYETPQLPGLRLHVPTLWTSPLPGPRQIVTLVQQMLNS